eukprot:GHVH01017459.1.p1 GENE.GHVH01017459.1~~GHVH01017459.1.p1  ORF type:complete len:1279 (+),score=199.22 GHVH01017459.1:194-4030(+)
MTQSHNSSDESDRVAIPHVTSLWNLGDHLTKVPPHKESKGEHILNEVHLMKEPKYFHDGSALKPSDYTDNQTNEIIGKLESVSRNFKDIIEDAARRDPETWKEALDVVAKDFMHDPLMHVAQGNNRNAVASLASLADERHSDIRTGLTASQASVNLEKYGENKLAMSSTTPTWRVFLNQFRSAVVLLLLGAGILALSFGEWAEGAVIAFIVLLNAAMATYMEKSAEGAMKALADLSSPVATIIRDGIEMEIDSKLLVPGDVVKLMTGDTVPADIRFIESNEIKCNEALLTGEPDDMKKMLIAKDGDAPFASNLAFSSTSVTAGKGLGLVLHTGMQTQVGKIAVQLQSAGKKKTGEKGPWYRCGRPKNSSLTPLQVALNKLGGIIGLFAICILVIIVVVALVTDYEDPSHPDQDRVLGIVMLAVSFAISSIPEGLPMVVTICLSLGSQDMVKRKANMRKLPAVETLGCCQVVCSDKTGTLTEGRMTAMTLACIGRGATGGPSPQKFSFWPTKGFNPAGGLFKGLTVAQKDAILLESTRTTTPNYSSISKNYGVEDLNDFDSVRARAACLAVALNSYSTIVLEPEDSRGAFGVKGNMSEGALVVAAMKSGFGNVANATDKLNLDPHTLYPRIDKFEVPFSSRRKMMATVHKLPKDGYFDGVNLGSDAYTHIAVLKGAPDFILPHAKLVTCLVDGHPTINYEKSITDSDLDDLQQMNSEMAEQALRVLLACIIPLSGEDLETLETAGEADDRLDVLKAGPVTILGAFGSIDPPRAGVPESIETCHQAGVRVIMITGDQKKTAEAIAADIGITNNPEDVVECRMLHEGGDAQEDFIDDGDLKKICNHVNVFSRAQPEDKIKIVQCLQSLGNVSAMTGDGVNDAPALQAADIGISMGIAGTDVAKGASDMVLLDDNFSTITSAIEEGRRVYANIQKFVAFLLGTNIGEIIYLTTSICAGLKMPVEALQILWLNLASDGGPAVALSREVKEPNSMNVPPRANGQPIVTKDWWLWGILPHTVFEAICVILSLVLSMHLCSGAITIKQLTDQCLTTAIDDVQQNYFCQTPEWRMGSGWITNVSYYDPTINDVQLWLGAKQGFADWAADGYLSPQSLGLNISAADCLNRGGSLDDLGWCKPFEVFHDNWSTALSSKKATTMSFLTAVYCESLRAYTVRSWEPFWFQFNSNPWLHITFTASFVGTLCITGIPGVNTVFGSYNVSWWQYLFGLFWAFLNFALDEVIPKPLYRRRRNIKAERAVKDHGLIEYYSSSSDEEEDTRAREEPG